MPRKRRDRDADNATATSTPELVGTERPLAETFRASGEAVDVAPAPIAPPREIERLLTWVADSARSTRTRLDAAEALVRWAAEHLDHPAAHLVAPAIEYVEAVADHAVTSEPTDRVRAAVLLLEMST